MPRRCLGGTSLPGPARQARATRGTMNVIGAPARAGCRRIMRGPFPWGASGQTGKPATGAHHWRRALRRHVPAIRMSHGSGWDRLGQGAGPSAGATPQWRPVGSCAAADQEPAICASWRRCAPGSGWLPCPHRRRRWLLRLRSVVSSRWTGHDLPTTWLASHASRGVCLSPLRRWALPPREAASVARPPRPPQQA
jgi:hypothetical protein